MARGGNSSLRGRRKREEERKANRGLRIQFDMGKRDGKLRRASRRRIELARSACSRSEHSAPLLLWRVASSTEEAGSRGT